MTDSQENLSLPETSSPKRQKRQDNRGSTGHFRLLAATTARISIWTKIRWSSEFANVLYEGG